MGLIGDILQQGGGVVAIKNAPPFEVRNIIRHVPQRRLVCSGVWNGRPVVAKLFEGAKAARDATRDAAGIRAFLQAGIAAPALLMQGELPGVGQVLVYEEIQDARNAETLEADNPAGSLELARRLVAILALHHRAGLVQTDLYLKNFLVRGETIYSLDGDGVRGQGKPLGKKRSLDHLAQLLSKFDVLAMQKWLPALLMQYLAERKWTGVADLEAMKVLVSRHRYASMEKYAGRKVFRTCTDVDVQKSWRRHFYAARPRMDAFLAQWRQSPDAPFASGAAQMLKAGNTCTVVGAQFGQESVVIKRYNIKNPLHGVSRALRRTRAAISWANAFRLKAAGIATAEPVALLEKRFGPLRREAYFVMGLVDAPDALEYFADQRIGASDRELAAQAVARLFHKLLALGITHGDCKATNVKVLNGEPWLIDLDSMRQYKKPDAARRGHIRDLRRWLRNWPESSATRALLEQALNNEYEDTGLLQAAGLDVVSKTT